LRRKKNEEKEGEKLRKAPRPIFFPLFLCEYPPSPKPTLWFKFSASFNCHVQYRTNMANKRCVYEHIPFPMPLTTAPSLTPDVLALLDDALWGAKLGKNKQLERENEKIKKAFQFIRNPSSSDISHISLSSLSNSHKMWEYFTFCIKRRCGCLFVGVIMTYVTMTECAHHNSTKLHRLQTSTNKTDSNTSRYY